MVYVWFACGGAKHWGEPYSVYAVTIVYDHPAGDTLCVWESEMSHQLRHDDSEEHWSYGAIDGYMDEFGTQQAGFGAVEDARNLPSVEYEEQGSLTQSK